jgi:hypothetical protein
MSCVWKNAGAAFLMVLLLPLLALAGAESAPVEVTATPDTHSAEIQFLNSGDDNGDATVWLEYKRAGTVQWTHWNYILEVSPNLYVDTLLFLDPDTDYDFRVNVFDPDGVSPQALTDQFRTLPSVPSASPVTHYRSIGTNTEILYQRGVLSIPSGSNVMTFWGGATLPGNVGIGDRINIGGTFLYIVSRESDTLVTVEPPATFSVVGGPYRIERAYNTLQDWEDDRDGNLIAEDRLEVGVAYNDGPFSSRLIIDGSLTDAEHYMMLTVAEGHRHRGVTGTGVVIDAGGGVSGELIAVKDPYTRIEWFELTNFKNGNKGIDFDNFPEFHHADNSTVSNLLIHDFDCGNVNSPLYVRSNNITIRNTVITDGTRAGIRIIYGSATIENCTIFRMFGDGVRQLTGTDVAIRNTISLGNDSQDFDLEGGVSYFGYNMYSTTQDFDPSALQGHNQPPPSEWSDLFVSTVLGSEDLHLEEFGHQALGTALNLSSLFLIDIDGEIRNGAWDIGADHVICGACKPEFYCGDGVIGSDEECDGADDAACPGACQIDCSCGPFCGDDILNGSDACDGTDDDACPGACLSDCTCGPFCGDDVRNGSDACDGTDDDACPGACLSDCTCGPFCGDDVRNGSDECDGADDDTCPGSCLSDCTCGPFCGDDILNGSEACDGTDDAACPGACQGNCTCGPFCGDDILNGSEACDGTDDAACPGACLSDCTCGPFCGDGARNGSEACDGANDAACPGACQGDCSCGPFCGDGLRQGLEQCDASDDTACPGACQSNCTCGPFCGDDVTNGEEQCDGSSDASCPGACQSDCTCSTSCGDGLRQGDEQCDGVDSALCPGACQSDCTCSAFCGDGLRQGLEQCDDVDDKACLGACQSDCTCADATIHYRSIGTNSEILYSTGSASIAEGGRIVTFGQGASLPDHVGTGDALTIGSETFFIRSRRSATQATVQQAASSSHLSPFEIRRAFNSLQSWESARDGNLVGEDRREVGVAYNDGPFNERVRLSGSATDSTHYVKLTVAEGQRHGGVPGAGVVLDGGGLSNSVIRVEQPYTKIEWLEMTNVTGDRGIELDDSPSASYSVLSHLLIHDLETSSSGSAIRVRPNHVQIHNTMIFDGDGYGIRVRGDGAVILNCTIFGMSMDGVRQDRATDIVIQNTISLGNGSQDFDLEGRVAYFGYNMYSTTQDFDPSALQGHSQPPPANLDDLFVSVVPELEDLHLERSAHRALGTASDLSSLFLLDIDKETRSGAWDIGADHINCVSCKPEASCGDGIRNAGEECDDTDDAACPGACQGDCTCGPFCGDGARNGSEACDGPEDAACPKACQSDCTCGTVCGDGTRDGSEACDGADDAACPGACQGDCTCGGATVHYRSIGTNKETLYSVGNASIARGGRVVTFGGGASLSDHVGTGDGLTVGDEKFFILSRNSATQVTVQAAASSTHSNEGYTIRRAFNSLRRWERAQDGDLVGDNRVEVGVAYNDGPFNERLRISGSTTDATHYMKLTVAEGHRHQGVPGSGVLLDGEGIDHTLIKVKDPYTKIEWLEITNFTNHNRAIDLDNSPSSSYSVLSHLLIHDFDAGSRTALRVRSDYVQVHNSMIFSGTGDGIQVRGDAVSIFNCTLFRLSDEGLKAYSKSDRVAILNTVSVGNGDEDFDLEGTVSFFGYNMFSVTEDFDPAALQGGNQSPPANLEDLFVSVAPGAVDPHLELSGHAALGTALTLGGYLTTDIDGETRGTRWDLGADQTQSAVQPIGDPQPLLTP